MENKQDRDTTHAQFRSELQRRFDALEQWAIAQWPDQARPLSHADFSPMRYELTVLGGKLNHDSQRLPEPSEGGPQYINMNAAPWP